MVSKLATILLLMAGVVSGNGWQSASPQTASPSLTDTTEWLEAHLVGVTHGSRRTMVTYSLKKGKLPKESDRQTTDTHESVSLAKFDGCSLTIAQLTKGDDYSVITTSVVPLDRMTSASLKTEKIEPKKTESAQESTETSVSPESSVVITLDGSTSVISYRRKSTGSVAPEWNTIPYEGKSSSLVIRSDDEELPPRLVKALNHAMQLCHTSSKPEPF